VGAGARAVRDAALDDTRDEPWTAPTLVGTTRVRQLLATERDAMVADYSDGTGCVHLARKYGVAQNTVLVRLKQAGVQVRRQGDRDLEELREMATLRREGWTLNALGERYGLTRRQWRSACEPRANVTGTGHPQRGHCVSMLSVCSVEP